MSHKAMCYLWKSYDCESFEIRSHTESCSPSNYNLKQGSPLQGHQHRTVLFWTSGRNRGRGSRRRATRRRGNPYPQRSGEGGSATPSPEAQSLISSRRSEASSTGMSRATSRISERPLLTVPEVAISVSDSPPPSHSLLPLPLDITDFFAAYPPPATIGADDPVGDALGIVLHAVATADPLASSSEPPP